MEHVVDEDGERKIKWRHYLIIAYNIAAFSVLLSLGELDFGAYAFA
jgi:hypothetical protein